MDRRYLHGALVLLYGSPLGSVRGNNVLKNFIIISLTALIAACASPEVDRTAMNFDQAKYETDLFECRGRNVLKATTTTVVLGTVGSLIGAFYGASLLVTGVEGIIAFASLGGVIGLAAGFETERKKHDDEIAGCLDGRGYTLTG